jgi:lysophospholipase L1-like esterase
LWLDLDVAARTLAAFVSLGLVMTCSSRGTWQEPQAPAKVGASTPVVSSATPPVSSGAPVSSSSASSFAPASATEPAPHREPESLALDRFYAALEALEKGQRAEHVRILWLGDSHTAADYLSDRLRRALQQRFGSGGPGFVRVGLAAYRHTGLKVARDGPWRIEPNPPARRSRQDDGVFGLGGLRAVAEASAHAELELTGGERQGPLRFEILYDVAPRASLEVKLGEKRELLGEGHGSPPIRRFTVEGDGASVLDLTAQGGSVKVWGVVIERPKPGVVLDTAGIDGARIATALAWDKDAFVHEVAARKPELGVIAYGTNEAFDAGGVDRYQVELTELVGRLRAGRPGLDCVIVGPPDAGTPEGGSPERLGAIEIVQREAARTLGCGFFSQRAFMGGGGSYWQWLRENPPLARPDRLHYSPKGYEKLGDGFANAVLAAYDARKR